MMKTFMRFSILAFCAVFLGHGAVTFGELQVHLKLDGDLVDSAGGDHHGMLLDGSRGGNQYVSGKLGDALDLANGDYTTGGDGVSIEYTMTDSGTVALWYKPRRIYNYNTIYDNSANENDWECWIYSDGRLRARVESDTFVTADLVSLSSDGDPRDEWFHVAFMWDRTSASTVDTELYVNGVLQDTNSGTWVRPGNTVFLGGGNNGNDFGDGTWDDVRIYDHVLSDAQVRSLAMRGLIVEPALIQLTENQTAFYSVVLDYLEDYEPQDDVFVSITADDNLSINGLAAGEAETLLFGPGTYRTPQTVQVTASDDSIHTGNRHVTLRHSITSTDAYWDSMQDVQLDVLVQDDDLACGDWGYVAMDFNRDCYVDARDLALFAEQWMACTDPSGPMCQYLSDVAIVAHRGYSSLAPENTIASCNAAREFADWVEFDVRVTLDNQLILMHDGTVDRTTNGTGDVGAMTLGELRQLDAGSWFSPDFSGELVPLMSEAVLATMPDMRPFIERKTGPAAMYVDLIRVLRIEQEAVVIAFDWDFLEEVEALLPAIRTGALGSETLTLAEIGAIQARGIDFIDWAHSTVTAETIDLVHAYGMELHVWTVNDADRMQMLIDWGIDGITTDDPELARELLRAQ
jgi:glycerophosphoryl diester phosphodiesterase